MRILITNNTLAGRAGSELWVRDVAVRLLERGHSPVAYSRVIGEVAAELRRETIPVVDDLDHLGVAPDVIHGHHHLETMTAVLHFPEVPAVTVCHGWLPPQEAPVRFPSLRRVLAVDEPTRDRLVLECGFPPSSVEILLNFVDLRRFRPRGPLPDRPRRALVLSNQAREDGYLRAIRTACRDAGVEVDAFGTAVGRTLAAPEAVLGDYDVVFAKGRTALEAACVGTAVILCDKAGLGELVTSDRLDRLRGMNFGIRTLRQEVTPQAVARELARYDPADAGVVSGRLRREADLDPVVDRLETIYSELVASRDAWTPLTAAEVGRAAAVYLRHGPLRGGDPWQRERERLKIELALARERLARKTAPRESRELAAQAARAKALETELAWITQTVTWRLRSRLLGWRWLRTLYRRARRLPDPS